MAITILHVIFKGYLYTSIYRIYCTIFFELLQVTTSCSVISLNLFTAGALPVTTPCATSASLPTTFFLDTAYVAVFVSTRMTPIRGSSGPPSCTLSPRSPSHAFSAGE